MLFLCLCIVYVKYLCARLRSTGRRPFKAHQRHHHFALLEANCADKYEHAQYTQHIQKTDFNKHQTALARAPLYSAQYAHALRRCVRIASHQTCVAFQNAAAAQSFRFVRPIPHPTKRRNDAPYIHKARIELTASHKNLKISHQSNAL